MSASVFPAYVGMSPVGASQVWSMKRVPRIRGDEPYTRVNVSGQVMCSPHTWG